MVEMWGEVDDVNVLVFVTQSGLTIVCAKHVNGRGWIGFVLDRDGCWLCEIVVDVRYVANLMFSRLAMFSGFSEMIL